MAWAAVFCCSPGLKIAWWGRHLDSDYSLFPKIYLAVVITYCRAFLQYKALFPKSALLSCFKGVLTCTFAPNPGAPVVLSTPTMPRNEEQLKKDKTYIWHWHTEHYFWPLMFFLTQVKNTKSTFLKYTKRKFCLARQRNSRTELLFKIFYFPF